MKSTGSAEGGGFGLSIMMLGASGSRDLAVVFLDSRVLYVSSTCFSTSRKRTGGLPTGEVGRIRPATPVTGSRIEAVDVKHSSTFHHADPAKSG